MTEDARKMLRMIINCEISAYMSPYSKGYAVTTSTNLANLIGWTKYRTMKAIKELMKMEFIEYTSEGRPAIESIGEYRELVCEAMPPINGYKLTEYGYQSKDYIAAFDQWNEDLSRMAMDQI